MNRRPHLDDLAAAAVAAGVPGAVVAIRDREGVRCGAAGVADLESNAPLEPWAQFCVASVGKTFLAALVLTLVDDGSVRLEDACATYLPELEHPLPGVTIRDLLRHTSGLGDFVQTPEYLAALADEPRRRWTTAELLALAGAPVSPPDERYVYASTNFLLLALIAERVGGRPLPVMVEERVAAPLGLRDTAFLPAARPVKGYAPADNPLFPGRGDEPLDVSERNAGIGFGADSIVSTAPDVARFLGGLLGGELLSPRMLAEMTTTVPADGVEAVAYGLGIAEMTSALGLSPSPCGPAWGHLGLRPGHTTIAFSRLDGSSQAVVIVNAGLFGSDVWTALGATAWHAYCGQAGDP